MASEPSKRGAVSERLRELGGLWHLWRANVLEELGELPDGFEACVAAKVRETLDDTRGRLQEALRACEETAAAFASSKCASSEACAK
jgi:hypothetical protein